MNRSIYYETMKFRAREIREKYGLSAPRVTRTDLRRIYRDQGITIDLWPHRLREVRGLYMNDEHGSSVMLAKGLPEDPMVFTMAHELKHHLEDQHLQTTLCSDRNMQEYIEIGAEIFAAEFIYPEQTFADDLARMGVTSGKCKAETLVHLKRQTRTTLSYAGLAKRAVFLGYALQGAFELIRWKKLEEEIYGVPIYKRWIGK